MFIAIAPNVIFIFINISAKTVHCFYEVSCKFVFGSLSVSLFLLIGSTRPPLGVETLPQCHHMAPFNYGGLKGRDLGQTIDVIRAILCLIVSPMIIER